MHIPFVLFVRIFWLTTYLRFFQKDMVNSLLESPNTGWKLLKYFTRLFLEFCCSFKTVYLKTWVPCIYLNLVLFWLSDEDTDLNALIKSWLRSQPEESRYNLENWIGDYFEKALNWVVKKVSKWILNQISASVKYDPFL